jgi:membrane protein YqaA with SNARE-associated domain
MEVPMWEHDGKGRLRYREWHETRIGRAIIVTGWVLLLGLCLCWACDVMPVQCAGTCAAVR